MCAKMGRPVSENPKNLAIKIRATKDDRALLDECCKALNKTQYEVVMEGIKLVKESIKK